jgi:hypothetical protein
VDTKTNSRRGERTLGSRMLEKAVLPIVAAAASAAAGYAAKKGPQLLEDTIGPKVRELVSGAGGAARDLPSKAKSAAGDAGDVAEHLTERVKSVAGGAGRSVPRRNGKQSISGDELARRTKERAQHRSQRRKAKR